MSPEEEQIQKIIRLKRYETPPEGYFDDFLTEFQKRRDEESRPEAPTVGFVGKFTAWFRGAGTGQFVLAGGVAYAALIVVVLMWPKGPENRLNNREPVIFQPKPVQVIPAPQPKPKDPPEKF